MEEASGIRLATSPDNPSLEQSVPPPSSLAQSTTTTTVTSTAPSQARPTTSEAGSTPLALESGFKESSSAPEEDTESGVATLGNPSPSSMPPESHGEVTARSEDQGSVEGLADEVGAVDLGKNSDQAVKEPAKDEPTTMDSKPTIDSSPSQASKPQSPLEVDDSMNATAMTSSPPDAIPLPHVEAQSEQAEEEWLLKSIAWPPLPPRPAAPNDQGGFETSELRVSIIQQNRNGPCSLIALCNVLILRNDLHIAPGRDRVTYSYLSALLADYFLRVTSSPSAPPSPAISMPSAVPPRSEQQLSLSAALSILPQTRYGLNLNPQFTRIDGFTSSNASGKGELALFDLARIPLLHGWIADPADEETYQVLKEAKDYDRSMEMLVEGSEVAGKLGLSGQGEIDLDDEELLKEAERRSRWTSEEEEKVRKAHCIDRFLKSTSTQLTYPGLFALSSTPSLLPPSGLAALFRNSHLSVLYRRPRTPTPDHSPNGGGNGLSGRPELFTLVTDSSFQGEEEIVWESLEDIDGSASEFFTAGLERSHTRGGDWAGVRKTEDLPTRQRESRGDERGGGGNEEADFALARQLQAEEEDRAAYAIEREEQRRFEAEEASRRHNEQLLDERRPASTSQRPGRESVPPANVKGDHRRAKSKAEKDKCIVM